MVWDIYGVVVGQQEGGLVAKKRHYIFRLIHSCHKCGQVQCWDDRWWAHTVHTNYTHTSQHKLHIPPHNTQNAHSAHKRPHTSHTVHTQCTLPTQYTTCTLCTHWTQCTLNRTNTYTAYTKYTGNTACTATKFQFWDKINKSCFWPETQDARKQNSIQDVKILT